MSEKIRLQKWVAAKGIASRREAERWIDEGRFAINGNLVTQQGTKIDPNYDQVTLDGSLVTFKDPAKVYWLFNKPRNYVVSRSSEDKATPTIYEIAKLRNLSFLISPVGRLDIKTEGLLILTNDGDLAHALMHPSSKVQRVYLALVNKRLTKDQEKEVRQGIKLKGGPTKNLQISYINAKKMGSSKGYWYQVTVFEGRNRLVRKLFEHFDSKVVELVRVGFAHLRLPESLKSGHYVQLKQEDINKLKTVIKEK